MHFRPCGSNAPVTMCLISQGTVIWWWKQQFATVKIRFSYQKCNWSHLQRHNSGLNSRDSNSTVELKSLVAFDTVISDNIVRTIYILCNEITISCIFISSLPHTHLHLSFTLETLSSKYLLTASTRNIWSSCKQFTL